VQIAELETQKRSLQGMLNNLVGKFAEHQLANEFRSRKRFTLSAFFQGVQDESKLNVVDVWERVSLQRDNGKRMEIDVLAESSCGRVVLVEVKKTKTKTRLKAVEGFDEKVIVYARQFPDKTILPAFLSLGGFTRQAMRSCREQNIGTAERIAYF